MDKKYSDGRSVKSVIFLHLLILVFGILFLIIYSWLDITCVLRYLTGIPCPTCGATRAMFSLIRLDFKDYLFFHPLALPLVLTMLGVFHIRLLEKWKIQIYIFVGLIVITAVVFYIYRLVNGLIP